MVGLAYLDRNSDSRVDAVTLTCFGPVVLNAF